MQQAFSIPPTLRTVWGAILSSTLLFLVMIRFTARPEVALESTMVFALAAVAASAAGVGLFLPSFLFRSALRAASIPVTDQPDPATPEAFGATIKRPHDLASARRAIVVAYTSKTLLGVALGEAVCLCGFILGYLGLDLMSALPFFLVGWLVMARHFPRAGEAARVVDETLGFRP